MSFNLTFFCNVSKSVAESETSMIGAAHMRILHRDVFEGPAVHLTGGFTFAISGFNDHQHEAVPALIYDAEMFIHTCREVLDTVYLS